MAKTRKRVRPLTPSGKDDSEPPPSSTRSTRRSGPPAAIKLTWHAGELYKDQTTGATRFSVKCSNDWSLSRALAPSRVDPVCDLTELLKPGSKKLFRTKFESRLNDGEKNFFGSRSSWTESNIITLLLTVAKDVAPARPSAPAVAKPTHPHIKLDDRQGFVSLLLADKGGSYPVIHPSYCTRISDFQPRTDAEISHDIQFLTSNYRIKDNVLPLLEHEEADVRNAASLFLRAYFSTDPLNTSSSVYVQEFHSYLFPYLTEEEKARRHVYVTEALTTSANYLYFTIRLAHPEIKTPSHNFTESVRLDVVGLDQAMTWFEQAVLEGQKVEELGIEAVVRNIKAIKPAEQRTSLSSHPPLPLILTTLTTVAVSRIYQHSANELPHADSFRFSRLKLLDDVKVNVDADGVETEHIIDAYSGMSLWSASAEEVITNRAESAAAEEAFPRSSYAGMFSVDGLYQVVFEDITDTAKKGRYHVPQNIWFTSLALNSFKHRYPPEITWLLLALVALGHQHPDFCGQADHPALPAINRLTHLIKLSYLVWTIPCEHYQRRLMRLKPYIDSRHAMKFMFDELGLSYYTPLPTVEEMLQHAKPADIQTLIQTEEERHNQYYSVRGAWTVRPGALPTDPMNAAKKKKFNAVSKSLETELLQRNLKFTKNQDGIISFTCDGTETAEDVWQDLQRSFFVKVFKRSPYELYAHAICMRASKILDGKKQASVMTKVIMSSNIMPTLPFILPFQSKGSLSTSTSRLEHLGPSGTQSYYATGFSDPSDLSFAAFQPNLSTFDLDAWVVNSALGTDVAASSDRLCLLKEQAKIICGDHWLLKPTLSQAHQQDFERVSQYLIDAELEGGDDGDA